MVFHSVSKTETPPPAVSKRSMASTFSAKSQPLPKFPLSNLQWSMNQSNAQRLPRVPDPSHLSPSDYSEHRPVFPLKNDRHFSLRKLGDSAQSPQRRSGFSSLAKNERRFFKLSYPTANSSVMGNSNRDNPVATEHLIEKEKSAIMNPTESLEKKLVGTIRVVEKKEKLVGSEAKSKIFIRIPARSKATADVTNAMDEIQYAVEGEQPVGKIWNLRPRQAVTKPPNVNGGAPKSGVAPVQDSESQAQIQPELAAARAAPELVGRKRQELSISLLKEEIEEDFLLMTGSRPPRRPKKRARNVQNKLDDLFPGLWLTYVTPDLYQVPDTRRLDFPVASSGTWNACWNLDIF